MSSAHAAQSSIKLRLLPANDQDHSLSSFRSEKDPVRYPGEFKAWVKSWVALSRLWHERDVGQANASHYRAGKRSTARNGNHMPSAALVHLPPEILNLIMAYLRPQDLANLLQTPSSRLYHVAKSAIARRRHEITSLANLHAFLAYGGKMPLFYRTATMLLFGRHFVRLVPEAKSLLGLGYAIVLAWFMVLFYTVPFLSKSCLHIIIPTQTTDHDHSSCHCHILYPRHYHPHDSHNGFSASSQITSRNHPPLSLILQNSTSPLLYIHRSRPLLHRHTRSSHSHPRLAQSLGFTSLLVE